MKNNDPNNFSDHDPRPPSAGSYDSWYDEGVSATHVEAPRPQSGDWYDEGLSATPVEAPLPPSGRGRLRKLGRRAVAAAVATTAGFAGFLGIQQLQDGPEANISAPVTIEEPIEAYHLPETTPSDQLVAEFQSDFIDSTCDTPETALAAANIYHETFEAFQPQSLTEQELRAAVDTISAEIKEARSHLEFISLPPNYTELLADSQKAVPELPLQTYQAALSEMLAPLGTEAVYGWDASTARGMTPRGKDAVSLDPSSLESSAALRQAITGSMAAYALMPKSTLERAAAQKIFFGDVVDPQYAGFATQGWDSETHDPFNMIVIDATLPVGVDAYRITQAHEQSHPLQDAICKAELDLAWANQNPEQFVYNAEDTDELTDDEHLRAQNVTSLDQVVPLAQGETAPEAVVTRSYGARTQLESYATLVGENSLDPTNTETLFESPDSSDILYRQLSVHVARLQTLNPAEADFFQLQLYAAALENTAHIAVNEAYAQFDNYMSSGEAALVNWKEEDYPEEIQKSRQDGEKLAALRSQLHELQTGIPETQKDGVIESEIGTAASN